jgi:hypothetical protein
VGAVVQLLIDDMDNREEEIERELDELSNREEKSDEKWTFHTKASYTCY